jgi:hypothetical protein
MNNQIVLSALKTQLATKKAELENYDKNVYQPEITAIKNQVSQWFKDNVSEHIRPVKASHDSIEIPSFTMSSYAGSTLYIETDYRAEKTEDGEYQQYMKLSTYSQNIKSGEDNDMMDLIIAGKLADKFYTIQHEFLNVWSPLFRKASELHNKFHSELSQLNYSISDVERAVDEQAKSLYKQVGFNCQLNDEKYIHRPWESDDTPTLKDKKHRIKLQTGRSNYDYMLVNSFKIKSINKYKCTLEVSDGDDAKVHEVTVTVLKFDNFIEEVFEWQNGKSERVSANTIERFERYYGQKENA